MADVLCAYCGKPISEDELATDGETVLEFTPDSEAGPERSEFYHATCHQRQVLQARIRAPLEFGMGWTGLVTRLVDAIDAVGLPYEVEQVKEKFGGLRFYWHERWPDEGGVPPDDDSARHDRIEALIDAAEEESMRT